MSVNGHLGDIPIGAVIPLFWTSHDAATGATETMSGLAVTDIEIYKGTSMTQRSSDNGYVLLDTDGIDIDSVTGLNGISIDTGDNSDASFFASGSFYNVVVTPVTVDGQTLTIHLCSFRAVTAETVSGQPKVDMAAILGTAVSTPATAGILDVNVKNIDNDAASASGTVTFPNATVASTTNITAGTITTATNVTTVNGLAANVITATSINADAITAAKIADGAIDAATFAAGAIDATAIAANAIGASELASDAASEIAAAVWDLDATAHQTGGTFGQAIGDPAADTHTIYDAVVTAAAGVNVAADIIAVQADTDDIQARLPAALTANGNIKADALRVGGTTQTGGDLSAQIDAVDNFVDTEVASILAAVDTEVGAIKTVTDAIGATGTGLSAIPWNAAWDAEVQSEVQDALDAALADSVPADGSRPSLAQAAYMIVQFLMERSVSGTTVTIRKVDGSSSLMTLTINDGTTPTSITRTT